MLINIRTQFWFCWLQIIRALRYLHKNKHIVHRDLKPANIMLGENDKLTISMALYDKATKY